MPPKVSITKEKILNTAFEIVRTEGYQQLTTRNIAGKIGCSTQPIYRVFKNMKELENAVLQMSVDYIISYTDEQIKKLNKDNNLNNALSLMGLSQIMLMKEEPRIYEFLFSAQKLVFDQSAEILNKFIDHEVFYDHPYLKVIPKDELILILRRSWIFLHGYITLMGLNNMYANQETILKDMKDVAFPAFAWTLLNHGQVELEDLKKWENELDAFEI